jgi:adenylate cyclase
VLAGYGAMILAFSALARSPSVSSWLAFVGTIADAVLAVYVLGEHLPTDAHNARHPNEALSLIAAFLIQTGLRLRPGLVLLFTGVVIIGWCLAIFMVVGSPVKFLSNDEGLAFARRQAQGLVAFLASAFVVLYAVTSMCQSARRAWKEREDRLLISRFLPNGVAGDVVRGGQSANLTQRHACLLSIDIRGSSAMARNYPAATTVPWAAGV